MRNRTATLASLAAAAFASLGLIAFMRSGTPTTVADLQAQLSRQFHEQWTVVDGFEAVEITGFGKPANPNELVVGLRIRWDKQNSHHTAVTLYQAAGTYYVGFFRLDDSNLPAKVKSKNGVSIQRPVRIFLAFKS